MSVLIFCRSSVGGFRAGEPSSPEYMEYIRQSRDWLLEPHAVPHAVGTAISLGNLRKPVLVAHAGVRRRSACATGAGLVKQTIVSVNRHRGVAM